MPHLYSYLPLSLLLFLVLKTPATDHGIYRGPENNGIYPATGLIRSWPAEGPRLLWKRLLPGSSFSGVTVAEGRVYASEGNQCTVHAFTLDGTPVAQIPTGLTPYKRFGGGSRGNTIVSQGLVVTTSPMTDIYAVDLASQEKRWQTNVSNDWGESVGQGGWGYCESPILFDGKIILGATSTRPEDPSLMAFHLHSGELAWGTGWGDPRTTYYHHQSSPSSPACFDHRGRRLIAFSSHGYHLCADATTGKLLWEIPNRGSHGMTPIYRDGLLLFHYDNSWRHPKSLPYLSGLLMVRLSDDGSSFEPLWMRASAKGSNTDYSHAVILDGRVYIFGLPNTPVTQPSKASLLKKPMPDTKAEDTADQPLQENAEDKSATAAAFLCLDAATGKLLGSQPAGKDFRASGHVVAADGLVYFLELYGKKEPMARMRLFQPEAAGMQQVGSVDLPVDEADLKVKELEWQGRTAPVIAEGRLFIRYGSIFCYDLLPHPPMRGWRQDGQGLALSAKPPIDCHEDVNLRLAIDLPVTPAAAPVVDGEDLLILGTAGELLCLKTNDGALRWRAMVAEAPLATPGPQPIPASQQGRIVVALADGTVASFLQDGKRTWKTSLGAAGQQVRAPLALGATVVVQGKDLVGLAADSGQQRWRRPLPQGGAFGTPTPLVVQGRSAVLTGWGALIAVEDGTVLAEGLPQSREHSPAVCGENIFIWETQEQGSRIVALRLPPNAATPKERWQRLLPEARPGAAPLATGQSLHALTASGSLLAMDPSTGVPWYVQDLGLAKAEGPASLVLTGAMIQVIQTDGTTTVAASGREWKRLWRYRVPQGLGEPAFQGDSQYILSGTRLLVLSGQAPKEAMPLPSLSSQALSLTTLSANLATTAQTPFASEVIPTAWLLLGPIPGKNLTTDHLAALGGRAACLPIPGAQIEVTDKGKNTTYAFRPLPIEHHWTDKATGQMPAIDVTAMLERKYRSTAYLFTLVKNDRQRMVRYVFNTPGSKQMVDRLDLRTWLGGQEIEEGAIVALSPGYHPLMIQLSMGVAEASARIWMGPRLIDLTQQYEQLVAENDRKSAVWTQLRRDQNLPLILAAEGLRRERSLPGLMQVPSAVQAQATGKPALETLDLRFAAIPDRAYQMQITEVTQAQWQAVMGTQPWQGQDLTSVGPQYPVVNISWRDAVTFTQRLSGLDPAWRYRLPIEVEWSHAAHAGQDGRFCFGSDIAQLGDYAWFKDNSAADRYAQPVGKLKPNAFGLYDVHGNVWEWTGDSAIAHPNASPINPPERYRIAKGGAWFSVDWFCDINKSPRYGPDFRSYGIGFRMLREKVKP